MISNKKVINYKILYLFEIYNFCFGHVFIQDRLKILIFNM
jgi:hypothetical protein